MQGMINHAIQGMKGGLERPSHGTDMRIFLLRRLEPQGLCLLLGPGRLLDEDRDQVQLTKAGHFWTAMTIKDGKHLGGLVAGVVGVVVVWYRGRQSDLRHGDMGIFHGFAPSLHIANAPGHGRFLTVHGLTPFVRLFRHGRTQIRAHTACRTACGIVLSTNVWSGSGDSDTHQCEERRRPTQHRSLVVDCLSSLSSALVFQSIYTTMPDGAVGM